MYVYMLRAEWISSRSTHEWKSRVQSTVSAEIRLELLNQRLCLNATNHRLNSSRPIIRYTRPARTHKNTRSYILPARPTLHFSPPRTPFHLPFNKFNCTCESSCQTWCTAFPNQSRAECMFFVGFPTCKFLFYAPSPLEKVTTNGQI